MADLTWPQDRMVKLLDITKQRLSQLVAQGVITKHSRGRYNPFVVNVQYIRFLRDRVSSPDESDSEMSAAKLAKIRAERELIDLEVSIRRKDRIPVEVVREVNDQVHQGIAAIIKSNRDKVLTEEVINQIFTELREVPRQLKFSSNGQHRV